MRSTAAWILVFSALALGAGPSFGEPSFEENGLLARYAVVLGEQSAAMPSVTSAEAQPLLDGLPDFDEQALVAAFGLTSLRTLQVGAVRLDDDGGSFSATADAEDGTIKIELHVTMQSMDGVQVTKTQAEVWRGNEILVAPTVTAVLGDVAIVTSSLDDGRDLLWLITRIDDGLEE